MLGCPDEECVGYLRAYDKDDLLAAIEEWNQWAEGPKQLLDELTRLRRIEAAARDAENALHALIGLFEPDNLTMQTIYRGAVKKHKALAKALDDSEAKQCGND